MAVSSLSSIGDFHRLLDSSESETSADEKSDGEKLIVPTKEREMAGKAKKVKSEYVMNKNKKTGTTGTGKTGTKGTKGTGAGTTGTKGTVEGSGDKDKKFEEEIMEKYLVDWLTLLLRVTSLLYILMETGFVLAWTYVFITNDRLRKYLDNYSYLFICLLVASAITLSVLVFEIVRSIIAVLPIDGLRKTKKSLFHWKVEAVLALLILARLPCYIVFPLLTADTMIPMFAMLSLYALIQVILSIIFVCRYYGYRKRIHKLARLPEKTAYKPTGCFDYILYGRLPRVASKKGVKHLI